MTANLALEQAGASTNELKAGVLLAVNLYSNLKSKCYSPVSNINVRTGCPYSPKVRSLTGQVLQISGADGRHTIPNPCRNRVLRRPLQRFPQSYNFHPSTSNLHLFRSAKETTIFHNHRIRPYSSCYGAGQLYE